MSAVVWVTGLPSSGKTTFANRLADALRSRGTAALVYDSDEIRRQLFPNLTYDDAARDTFYGALARLAALCAHQRVVAIVAATAHRRVWRAYARALAPTFIEVHIATPLDVCRQRDSKGLFAQCSGQSLSLPGMTVPYELPEMPEVTAVDGNDERALTRAARAVLDTLHGRGAAWRSGRTKPGAAPKVALRH